MYNRFNIFQVYISWHIPNDNMLLQTENNEYKTAPVIYEEC